MRRKIKYPKFCLINQSDFKNKLVRKIINFVSPPGIDYFAIRISSSNGKPKGFARYPENGNIFTPFAEVIIGDKIKFPYKKHYRGKKTSPTYLIYSQEEVLVQEIAHELRHLWQGNQMDRSNYYPKTVRFFSEIDAEYYAMECLLAWRAMR